MCLLQYDTSDESRGLDNRGLDNGLAVRDRGIRNTLEDEYSVRGTSITKRSYGRRSFGGLFTSLASQTSEVPGKTSQLIKTLMPITA